MAAHTISTRVTPVERAGYVTDILSERAAAWIAAASARPEPYFLSLHYTAPHWPWSAPSVEAAAARQREIERTELTEGGNTRIYGDMMQSLDAGIGRVLDAVWRGPGDESTLVVFTSDNGGERFSKIWPFVGRKFDLLEGGLRVPQICRWPGRIEPGRITDQVSITMDLTVTCLAAAGVAAAPDYPLDGVDLLDPDAIAANPRLASNLSCGYRKSHPGWRRCRDGLSSLWDDRPLEAARRIARRSVQIACGSRSRDGISPPAACCAAAIRAGEAQAALCRSLDLRLAVSAVPSRARSRGCLQA